jgi:hypothetical protein
MNFGTSVGLRMENLLSREFSQDGEKYPLNYAKHTL